MSYMKSNTAFCLGSQNARGTASTTGKAAMHYVTATKEIQRDVKETGPALGRGHANQKRFNTGFKIPVSAEGIITLSSLPSHLLTPLGSLSANETLSSGAKKYTFDAAQISTQVKLFTAWFLYNSYWNGSAFTTPTFKKAIRDCIMTAMSYTMTNNDAPKWNTGFTGANEGPGSNSDALSMDTDYQLINPANAATLDLTAGDLIPDFSVICGQSLKVEPEFNTQEAQCFNKGEYRIESVVKGAKFTLETLYEISVLREVEEYVHYLTQTPPSTGTTSIIPGFLEQPFYFKAQAGEIIPGDTDDTRFGLEGDFPSVQWIGAKHDLSQEYVKFTLEGVTYATDFKHYVYNNKSLGQMTI